jgi:hypothetical protein
MVIKIYQGAALTKTGIILNPLTENIAGSMLLQSSVVKK